MIFNKFLIIFLLVFNYLIFSSATADQSDPRLDELFLNVKDSQDELSSSVYIASIWKIWSETNDPKSQQLYNLGNQLLKQRKYDQSLIIFNQLIINKPDFAEGWNKKSDPSLFDGQF